MAKNSNPAGNSATASNVNSGSVAATGVESAKDAASIGVTNTSSVNSEASDTTTSFKIDVKTALTGASAAAASTTSESQVTSTSTLSKQRKVNILSPIPPQQEENNVDLTCLLLADTSLKCAPVHLRKLLQHVEGNATITPAEILLLLVYCVALETGFITCLEFINHADSIMHLSPTSSYHSKNVLHMSHQMPSYSADDNKQKFVMQLRNIVNIETNGTQSAILNSQLTCIVTGDLLILTHTPDRITNIPGRSICLSIGRYVLNAQPKGKELFQCFRKLDELSKLLRENVFVPVRNAQLEGLAVSVFPALLGMPAELYENVFKNLSQNQLRILANVNKQLYYLSTHSKYHM